ncbi:MAG TPA: DUF4097 family beta strand repeat-containing protein [Bryobacteraceae bacterium]|nr:DUF4097 family beta strand repeat-containing protein [Bryobacteraceae bacterium]
MRAFKIAALSLVGAVSMLAGLSPSGFRWTGTLTPGESIEVQDANGNIRAEPSDGKDVEVVARRESPSEDVSHVQIRVMRRAEGIVICAVYPKDQTGPADCATLGTAGFRTAKTNRPQSGPKVEFAVRVPKGVRFVARTVNGSVEAKALRSDLEAYTVNGNVKLSTTGTAHAETVNGSITGMIGDRMRDLRFSTVNGNITLGLPLAPNAEIRAKTVHGQISTNLRLPVRQHFASHTMNGKVGSGGGEVDISTVNGSIHLRRGCSSLL